MLHMVTYVATSDGYAAVPFAHLVMPFSGQRPTDIKEGGTRPVQKHVFSFIFVGVRKENIDDSIPDFYGPSVAK